MCIIYLFNSQNQKKKKRNYPNLHKGYQPDLNIILSLMIVWLKKIELKLYVALKYFKKWCDAIKKEKYL